MMKFLVFVFGVVAVECVDAKLWHGDDRSNETFRIFLWIAYLKRLSLIAFMLLSVLLYYVPESRTHARKACFFLIDTIAEGLKLALRATESEHDKYGHDTGKYIEYIDKFSRRDTKRSSRDRDRLVRDETSLRRREGRRTSSRHRSQEGKYQRRDRRHYLETALDLLPMIRDRYRTCAVVTLNEACPPPMHFKNEYDPTLDRSGRRDGIVYSKQEGVVGYEDDYRPIDSGISTNFYDSPNNRLHRNVADILAYRQEIVGDNEYFVDTKEGRSAIRQMQGDTIPEIPCNETSYTSLEAEADDEYSQCENETVEVNVPKEREVERNKRNTGHAGINDVPPIPSTTRRYYRPHIPETLIAPREKGEERSRSGDFNHHVRSADVLTNVGKRYLVKRQRFVE